MRTWKCKGCGREVQLEQEDIAAIGVPICGQCDTAFCNEEMELQGDAPEPPRPGAARPSHLINRAKVRQFILDTFGRTRPHLGITRVSQEAMDQLEYWLREKIRSEIRSHPSVGKTFKL